jgi:[ribosomal protein S5]-alanine N-acetyltransferase
VDSRTRPRRQLEKAVEMRVGGPHQDIEAGAARHLRPGVERPSRVILGIGSAEAHEDTLDYAPGLPGRTAELRPEEEVLGAQEQACFRGRAVSELPCPEPTVHDQSGGKEPGRKVVNGHEARDRVRECPQVPFAEGVAVGDHPVGSPVPNQPVDEACVVGPTRRAIHPHHILTTGGQPAGAVFRGGEESGGDSTLVEPRGKGTGSHQMPHAHALPAVDSEENVHQGLAAQTCLLASPPGSKYHLGSVLTSGECSRHGGMANELRRVEPQERFPGRLVTLRLVTLADCTPTYVAWLNDPAVNRHLETRWQVQSLESVTAFVQEHLNAPFSYLFAILENANGRHIGNIKIGPINPHHLCADISYFLGERSTWGRGCSTEAIGLVVDLGFSRLDLHRIQAGVYSGNGASRRALEKAGFRPEGMWRRQLRVPEGWEDHLFYGILREEWETKPARHSR